MLASSLSAIVGARWVKVRRPELAPYDADGLPGYRATPSLAVLPGTKDELIAVVCELARQGVPWVPRGAGTGLSGGALADDVVLIGLNRLTRIIEVDPVNRLARVEPGVVNAKLSRETTRYGLQYAPDPSSQTVCTIGGNVAENAGGPHCLKYGVTMNHVVECEVLLPDGTITRLGGAYREADGYDLLGAFVGSEGCFGIATEVTVRLVPLPDAVHTLLADFSSVNDAAHAVSRIVATGIVPAALEMMDNATIRCVEASIYAAGYPVDAAAILLCEVDGVPDGLDDDVALIRDACMTSGARGVRVATEAADRLRLWQGRK
ncbi:FAD-binding protein, partial [Gemmatimonas sp.]|uniref:FAD-binding protein n=1 Tax=Gemmatimonas sp. TaxID=1962908 RepID=UPI00391D833A